MIFYWFAKGATAYEAQFGRIVIRICHLRGNYWRFKPWRRISVKVWPKSSNDYSKSPFVVFDNLCDRVKRWGSQ